MEPRINMSRIGGQALSAIAELGKYLAASQLEESLLDLIYFRVSQINGCAHCLDRHSKDLRAKGEIEQRLYLLSAWKEAPFYTDKEISALAWAEALTTLKESLVPEDIYAEASRHFSDLELVDLTVAVITINGYNRLNITFGANVGSYLVGQWKQ